MPRRQRASILLGSGLLFALGACNDLLGIEPAVIDPRLAGLGNGAQAGSSVGTGGSNAMAGTGLAPSAGSGNAGDGGSAHQHSGGSAGKAPTDGGEAGEVGTTGGAGGTGGTGGAAGTGGTGGSTAGTAGSHDHSSGGTGGDGGEAGDGQGGPSGDPCEEYCDMMEDECKDEAAQYRDRDQCLRICSLLPLGDMDRKDDEIPNENSVACRTKYAKKTHYGNGSEVTIYCRQAGPSGDGKCGSECEGFCSLMASVCTPEESPYYHFESDEECLTTCNGLPPATVEYSSSDPLVSDGNHALCRLFHVANAAMADAEEHCEHAMGVTLCQATEP